MAILPESANKIVENIGERKFKPIYFLMGEEPYFIDELASLFEDKALPEEDKSFNQSVFYGNDIDSSRIVSEAKRFPMMAEKQLVLIREAHLIKQLAGKEKEDSGKGKKEDSAKDVFLAYCENPLPSTILVVCYKGKTLDKRKALYKAIEKNGVIFNSEEIKDYNLAKWIGPFIRDKGYKINEKATQMMSDYLGNDLGKIANELSKLAISLPKGTEITEHIIEQNIGISKEYNVFELQKAISTQNVLKANLIINYFIENPKSNPSVVWISNLYGYFSKLLQIHYFQTKKESPADIAGKIGVPFFIYSEYQEAASRYSFSKVSRNMSTLRELDMRLKGVDSGEIPSSDFLREFIYKIIHTR